MENFYLDDDENFDKTCGEMILTTKGRLAFYCTLCGEYKTYESFIKHLLKRCLHSLDEDLKECITENSLLNSLGSSFLSAFQKNKISSKKSKDENLKTKQNQIETDTEMLEPGNLDLQDDFTVDEFNNAPITSKIEYLEESILSAPEQSVISSCIEMDSKVNQLNDLENEEFDIEPDEIEYCDDDYEEMVNVEHLDDENEITHAEDDYEYRREEDEQESRDEENFDESRHEEEMQNLENWDLCQPEQYKRNQEQQNPTSNTKKRKGPVEIDISGVVRDVCKRTRYKPSTVLDEERKHKCPICGFAFKDVFNMRHHLRRHTDQKNHSCPQCNKRFFSSTEVKIHLKSHGNVEKTFLCPECGLGFHTNYRLISHQKRHKNQKDYICKICEKGFYNGGTLKTHMSCHSSDRPFSCEICGATFKRRNGVREHRKQHENERKYKCKICGAAFNVHAGLYSHMKSKHKDTVTFNE